MSVSREPPGLLMLGLRLNDDDDFSMALAALTDALACAASPVDVAAAKAPAPSQTPSSAPQLASSRLQAGGIRTCWASRLVSRWLAALVA